MDQEAAKANYTSPEWWATATDEAVVRAAVSGAEIHGGHHGKVWVYSPLVQNEYTMDGMMSKVCYLGTREARRLEAWKDARTNNPAVQAFEAKHNPKYAAVPEAKHATWMEICGRCGKLRASHRDSLCYPDTAPSAREEFQFSGRFAVPEERIPYTPGERQARPEGSADALKSNCAHVGPGDYCESCDLGITQPYSHTSPEQGEARDGALLIAAERARQISVEGWTAEHDAQHRRGEIAYAAAVYAHIAANQETGGPVAQEPSLWPWDYSWYKPSSDPVRNLIKAGALIAAEIDRLNATTPLASPKAAQVQEGGWEAPKPGDRIAYQLYPGSGQMTTGVVQPYEPGQTIYVTNEAQSPEQCVIWQGYLQGGLGGFTKWFPLQPTAPNDSIIGQCDRCKKRIDEMTETLAGEYVCEECASQSQEGEWEELRKLAEDARKDARGSARWLADYHGDEDDESAVIFVEIPPDEVGGVSDAVSVLFEADWGTMAQARFIAKANPAAVLELISQLRASQAALVKAKDQLGDWRATAKNWKSRALKAESALREANERVQEARELLTKAAFVTNSSAETHDLRDRRFAWLNKVGAQSTTPQEAPTER